MEDDYTVSIGWRVLILSNNLRLNLEGEVAEVLEYPIQNYFPS